MELEESVASIWYIFLFAVFLTIIWSQSEGFKTTITGLETLSEFQTDMVNDFIYSPCFIAKNKQGNNLHGVFDADLLDSHTEQKLLSEIISLPAGQTDYTINYAPTVTNCTNTKDTYYFYEIREKENPNARWIFGNSSKLGFLFDEKTWTHNKKPISIKRGDTISSGVIVYGFSKNPPKPGLAFVMAPTTTELCENLGGTVCDWGKSCNGDEPLFFEMYTSPADTIAAIIDMPDISVSTTTPTTEPSRLCCYNGGVCEP